MVKNLPADASDVRDTSSIPGLGRSPGRGLGNPLQCSCLENPMDREAWQATVHKTTNSMHTHICANEDFQKLFVSSQLGNGKPLQCSCLENPRDGEGWWAAVCGVAQSQTRLKRLSSSSHFPVLIPPNCIVYYHF